MHDTFISYSSIDANIANAVCHNLEQGGIRCWMAPRDIPPGCTWPEIIPNAIQEAKVFVLIFSDNSNNSDQVARELSIAVNNRLMIFPFKITKTDPQGQFEYFLTTTHWLDAIDKPLKLSIEHMRNVISLYLKEMGEEEFNKGFEKEKEILDRKIKEWKKKRLIIGVTVSLLAIMSMFFLWNRYLNGKPSTERMISYSASIHMMRYKDADSTRTIFNDSLLSSFRYDKDYNGNHEYCVFPMSDFIAYDKEKTVLATNVSSDSLPPIAFHYPIIQLTLNSHEKKSITMSEAVLEIRDMHRDEQPALRFNVNSGQLMINDENFYGEEQLKLAYSSLMEGESFLDFKKRKVLTISSPIHREMIEWKGDSIIGEIEMPNHSKVIFTSGRNIRKTPYSPTDTQHLDYPLYMLEMIQNQDIRLRNFNRSLIENEVDNGFAFRIGTLVGTTFKMRLRININGSTDSLYTNFIKVRLSHPRNGFCYPK